MNACKRERLLILAIILLIAAACSKAGKKWKYEIGEKAVHKLTADTVLVVDRYSVASGKIIIRHKDFKLTQVEEEELRKVSER